MADDDVEKSKAAQALRIVQDLLASNQKLSEQAVGGVRRALRAMQKALSR